MPAVEVHGSCDPRFARVRDAFAGNFATHDEVGAAVAVSIDGRVVVDLWAGWMDAGRTRPWRRDTLVNVFSVGKGMAALSLLLLVERGQVDLDAPAARYWPELGAGGKTGVTVRMLLAHQAGVPGIRRPLRQLAMYDWGCMTSALAREEPWWTPGTAHGYHVNTFGFLVGELVRRVTGMRLGAFFRREIAGPLDADFHFGIAAQHDDRVADVLLPDDDARLPDFLLGRTGTGACEDNARRRRLLERVYCNPPGISGFGTVNTRAWRDAEMPSTNGHATARAVARIYGALACGGRLEGRLLLAPETIAEARTEISAGTDFVLGRYSRFGLGFQLTQPERPLGPGPHGFGHFGAGGSLGFADPDARLAFAYVMNLPGQRWQDPRNRALVEAAYAAL
ncbi:MAG: serine hydrolase domain-containing protein [bacterium]